MYKTTNKSFRKCDSVMLLILFLKVLTLLASKQLKFVVAAVVDLDLAVLKAEFYMYLWFLPEDPLPPTSPYVKILVLQTQVKF